MFLNTRKIQLGSKWLTLSEYTALDRIADLRYSAGLAPIQALSEDASHAEKLEASCRREESVLDLVAYGIALSLNHAHPDERGLEVVKEEIKSSWPNAKVNEAYELLKQLNSPESLNEDGAREAEDVTPQKS
ncbi:phage minor tail protein domain-containing protein [Vibrio vulnificus]|uniref:phage minor tail protein domain-containing protein n=1 Tax=Vibrio vulnificus TaxID=672 RepID=UPI001A1BCA77|nr:phage minor tail protein G [Vibrio vulnificus]EGQ7854372.1 hypothetical protein [Vibrio vulnificus]EIE1227644.1 hypothetical protein [Vibrio vulnificus]MDK2679278.1 phage minor tail protein G [Vibrio vulnificus]MDK2688046.1 phage minor tail protein G [Vibrio vulnificus]